MEERGEDPSTSVGAEEEENNLQEVTEGAASDPEEGYAKPQAGIHPFRD